MPTSREPSSKSRGKRKEVIADDTTAPTTTFRLKRKKRKTHNNEAATQTDADMVDDGDFSTNVEEQLQTTSKGGPDNAETDAAQMDTTSAIHLDVDSEEEEKPKPVLNLTYQGFNIYGHCLCVVVEPWPVVRSMTTGLSNSKRKVSSVAESAMDVFRQQTSGNKDERTPLFLPEDDEEVSAPQERANTIEISDGESDSDGIGDMMAFSQALRSIGDSRAGAANDDEDMDGSILFGDADEVREL